MSEPLEIPPPREPSILALSARTAAILTVFTVVFTAMMALTYKATKPALEQSAATERLKSIAEVLPGGEYDNLLLSDAVTLPPVPELGLEEKSQVYRARLKGEPVALIVEAAAPDGYSGRIAMIMAVRADGRLAAVRVTQHKETPGLGDYIDPKKDRNKQRPWINQFNQRGFDQTPPEAWKVKKDGGVFDQMAGATISARAVTNATRRALAWVTAHRERLFAAPANSEFQE